MKGTLHETNNGWVIKYKMDSDLIATDGGMIPLHPEYEKYYFLDWDAEGAEVEFEIEPFWETGLEEVINVAKLIRKSKETTWDEIEEEYSKDNYPPFGGPFTDALSPWEWLKLNYNSPVRKKN